MRLVATAARCRKAVILVLAFALTSPMGYPAAGMPEWGMSSGAVLFMIRVVAIKSPPLSLPVAIIGAPPNVVQQDLSDSASWLEGYKVSLTNVTGVVWTRPVIQYIVYEMDSTGQVQQIHGAEALNEIPINGQITFVTNQVMMQRNFRTDGHNTLPGKLLGVRVRVYNYKNELIQDYAAPWAIMVMQKWDFPLTTEGGGAVTPRKPGVRLNG